VQLALQFCLSDEGVSTVIPGMMTCEEVRENAAAADLPPLTQQELEAIRSIYHSHLFYDPAAKSTAEPESRQ
jgi:aryl-alcohol dehydrogenase-like predicted oxidoreductase